MGGWALRNKHLLLFLGVAVLLQCSWWWISVWSRSILVLEPSNEDFPATKADFQQDNVVQHDNEESQQDNECAEYMREYPQTRHPRYLPTLPVDMNNDAFDLWTNTTYLPSTRLLHCARTLGPSLPWRRAYDAMKRRAEYLRNPEDCGKPRGIFRLNRTKHWHLVKFGPHGHGALVLMLVWIVGMHWDHGIPVLASTSRYRFSDETCGRGWTCHMSPLSSVCDLETTPLESVLLTSFRQIEEYSTLADYCSGGSFNTTYGRCRCPTGTVATQKYSYKGCRPENSFDAEAEDWEKLSWEEDLRPGVLAGKIDPMTDSHAFFANAAPGELTPHESPFQSDPALSSLQWALSDARKHYQLDTREAIKLGIAYSNSARASKRSTLKENPEAQPKRTLGFLWWWSHVAYLLHHPDEKDSNKARRGKSTSRIKAGWLTPRNCIAVHIRRGDSCNDPTAPQRKCHPISFYLDAINLLSNQYGTPDYVYVATDDENAIEEVRKGTRLEVKSQTFSRAKYNQRGIVIDDPSGAFSNAATLDELYRDIHEMVRCDSLVGSWSTSLLGLTYGLMVSRKGYYPPVISVDYAYGDEKTTIGSHTKENVDTVV